MNYKVLAVSAVLGIGILAVGLTEAQKPRLGQTVERLTAVDLAEPADLPSRAYAMEPSAAWIADRAPAVLPNTSVSDSLQIPAAEIPIALPQIAFVFSYGFRLAGPDIPVLQQRHADLCESKGPLLCRIVAMDQATDAGEYTAGTLQLAVAAHEARAFGKQLATIAERDDASQVSAAISGEDLSKQIVDTEARLRARSLLRDRLMEVLATRRGTVTELVEAERGVAQVNEEIDQARSWLAQMQGRVAFSQIDIAYESSVAPPASGFMAPVRGAVGSLGAIFGAVVAVLIVLGALALPALAIALAARHLWRRYRPEPIPAAA